MTRCRPGLLSVCLAMTFTSSAVAQLPRAITEDENIRVTEVTPEAALAQLQREYEELLRTKGAADPESRGVAEQIAQIRNGLAALGRPVPGDSSGAAGNTSGPAATSTTPAGSASSDEEDQVQLNADQVRALRVQYEQRRRQFGADDPMVKRLEILLNRINKEVLEAADESGVVGSSAAQAATPGGAAEPIDSSEMTDPYELLINLAERVASLEQEVLRLRGELTAMRRERSVPLVVPPNGRTSGEVTP